eukprot:scaffold13334_cov207-Alexandrium_tamarense.AAC.4
MEAVMMSMCQSEIAKQRGRELSGASCARLFKPMSIALDVLIAMIGCKELGLNQHSVFLNTSPFSSSNDYT